jgi:hypothetical protein
MARDFLFFFLFGRPARLMAERLMKSQRKRTQALKNRTRKLHMFTLDGIGRWPAPSGRQALASLRKQG